MDKPETSPHPIPNQSENHPAPDEAEPREIADLLEELDQTNRGLIAMYAELEDARQAEARLAAIVQSSNDAMLTITPDKAIQTWNPGAEQLFGYAPDQLIGRTIDLLYSADQADQFNTTLAHVRSGNHATPYEALWRRADGSLISVAVALTAIRDPDGQLKGSSTVARDITQQLRMQADLAAARAEQALDKERDRIASGLHNMIIRRIFRAELALDNAQTLSPRPKVTAQIQTALTELDEAIQQLRGTVFALTGPPQKTTSLRAKVLDLATSAQAVLGFSPDVTFEGQAEASVSDDIAKVLLTVLRAALSTIANPASVRISLTADDNLILRISSDSQDASDTAASERPGLQELVQGHGGTLQHRRQPGSYNTLELRLPYTNEDTTQPGT